MKRKLSRWIGIAILWICLVCGAIAATPTGAERWSGSWCNTITAEWELGFYPSFALINGYIYEYVSLPKNDKKGELVLCRNDRELRIRVQVKNDSLASFQFPGEKLKRYTKVSVRMPDYERKESQSGWSKNVGSVAIRGCIDRSNPNGFYSIRYYDSSIPRRRIHQPLKLDAQGRFETLLRVNGTTEIEWIYNNTLLSYDLVHPDEEYYVYYKEQNGQLLAMGAHARIHNEIYNSSTALPLFQISYPEQLKDDEPLSLFETMLKDQENRIENYAKKHRKCVDWLAYKRRSQRYAQATSFFRQFKSYPLSPTVVEEIDNMICSNATHEDFSLYAFWSYFGEYENTLIRHTDYQPPVPTVEEGASSHHLLYYLHRRGRISMSRPMQADLMRYLEQSTQLEVDVQRFDGSTTAVGQRKLAIDSLLLPYVEQIKVWKNQPWFAGYERRTWVPISRAREERVRLIRDRSLVNQMHFTPEAREVLHAGMNLAQTERDAQLRPPESLTYDALITPTNELDGIKTGEDLWLKMISRYRGKRIYVSIYGIWSGICKREMAAIPLLRQHTPTDKVAFIHIATNSPARPWEIFVKHNNLTGENETNFLLGFRTQPLIEGYLGILRSPVFLIVDETGAIVNTSAPPPSHDQEVLKLLLPR